jgi:hypothetical protein
VSTASSSKYVQQYGISGQQRHKKQDYPIPTYTNTFENEDTLPIIPPALASLGKVGEQYGEQH